jgi:two-component system cell cycle sensor histidine kinase/response regulator CckA
MRGRPAASSPPPGGGPQPDSPLPGALAAAVEQAPASIMITDAAGVVQFVNPAFEAVSGWTRTEIVGRGANVLKSGRHDEAFYRELWRTIRRGEVWKGRMVNRARDGHLFTEDAVITPVLDDGGTIRSYVAVKRDVSDELVLKEALCQAQRLEGIGLLAGGIAHDFNNVLTVILSCAEALREELAAGGTPGPRAREDVEEIHAAAARAADLTRQLLTFARRHPIEPVPLDLNGVLRRSERLLRRVIGEDVRLRVSLQDDLWAIRADPGQLEQVVLNLAVNARDAMPDGGAFVIETSNVVAERSHQHLLPGLSPGAYVRLSARDDGAGMTEEVRARAFEPFFTTKPPGEGTGLGLSTVYGIVKQSSGHIRVESAPGQGTSFELWFPRTAEAPRDPAAPRAAAPGGGTETVVLVEDDAQVRAVAERALVASGYRVLVAGGADDALRVAASEPGPIHLLVTDVVMPGTGGKPLAEEFSRRRPLAGVLFVSGYAEGAVTREGALPPGLRFLPKPFTPADLVARVRAVLDERSAPGPDRAR